MIWLCNLQFRKGLKINFFISRKICQISYQSCLVNKDKNICEGPNLKFLFIAKIFGLEVEYINPYNVYVMFTSHMSPFPMQYTTYITVYVWV